MGLEAIGQCPTKPSNPVVINEVSGDSGQSDASNDGIVELAGIPGTNIGGMVVTNGEWAVIIPAGTLMPADGVYLIACSQQSVSAAGGVAGEGITNSCVPGTNGLSCPQCDYPGLVPDFDVCNPANAIYYDPAASGFTIDNADASDGDQVVLFNNDGTIADAVKWGTTTTTSAGATTYGGSSGDADNVAPSTSGYTLGTPGIRGDGTAATGVPLMPAGNCPGPAITYVMPRTDDPRYVNLGTNIKGCNSSYQRSGAIATASLVGSGTDVMNAASQWNINTALTQTGIQTNNTSTAAVNNTNHPTPGVPNSTPAFAWIPPSSLNVCSPQTFTFGLEVYNYQHVSGLSCAGGLITTSGNAGSEIGSVVIVNEGAPQTWTSVTPNTTTGTTTLSFTTASLGEGTHTIRLQWDDYTNCCSGAECYESVTYTVKVLPTFTQSKTSISCPTDAVAGSINLSPFFSGGNTPYTYTISSDAGNVSTGAGGTLSGSIMTLPATATGTYIIKVEEAAQACGTPKYITVNSNCAAAPPACPVFINDASCSTPDGAKCPGDIIQMSLNPTSSTNLPNGGSIEWVLDTDNDNDVFDEPAGSVIASQTISVTASSVVYKDCSNLVAGDVVIVDIQSDADDRFSFIPLVNIAASTTIIFTDRGVSGSGWYASSGAAESGFISWTAPSGGVLAGNIITITVAGALTPGTLTNLSISGPGTISYSESGGSGDFSLANDGDQVLAYCGTAGTYPSSFIYGVTTYAQNLWQYNSTEGSNSSDIPEGLTNGSTAVAVGVNNTNGNEYDNAIWNCNTGTISDTRNNILSNVSDYTKWTGNNTRQSLPSCSVNVTGATSSTLTTLAPTCATYTIPTSMCNTTIRIKPRISPDPGSADCTGDNNPTLPSKIYTITCPSVTLTGGGNACAPTTVPLTITFTNPSTGFSATVNYSINGIAQTPLTITSSPYTLNATSSGTYVITSVAFSSPASTCNATISGSSEVTISPLVTATITGGTSPSTCAGSGTVSITLAGTAPWSFTLRNTTTGASYDLTSDASPYTATGLAPGTYSVVSVRDDNNCAGTTSGMYTVTAPADLPVLAVIPAQTVCSDSPVINLTSLNPTVTGGSGGGSYTWYYDDPSLPGTHILVPNPNSVNITVSRTFYVRYTDASSCTAYGSVMVNFSTLPAVTGTPTNQDCTAGTPAKIDVSIPAATGYAYTITTGTSGSGTLATAIAATSSTLTFTAGGGILTGTGGGLPSYPTTGGTSYTIRVFNTASGCFTDITRSVSSQACFVCPSIGNISTIAPICKGNTFNITATNLVNLCIANNTERNFGISFVNFMGTTPPSDVYSGGTLMGTVPYSVINSCAGSATLSNLGGSLDAGSYTICAILSPTSDNVTCRPYQCVTYTINALPTVTTTSNGPVCTGQTINLQTTSPTGLPASAYDWTGPGGYIQNDTQNPSRTGATISMAGDYTVTVTDVNNCSGVSTVNVVVQPLPSLILGTNPTVCLKSTTASLPFTSITGAPNQFSIDFDNAANAAGISDIPLTGLTSSSIGITLPPSLAAGTYYGTISVINSASSCTGIPVSFSITVLNDIVIAAEATCTGVSQPMTGMSLDISAYTPQYYITVTSVSGGNNANYNVSVHGSTQVYSGSPLTFGPFNHSIPLTGNAPIIVTASDYMPNFGLPTCSGTTSVDETICAPSGVYCDCSGTAPVPPNGGVIIAQANPGTYNNNGYTQFYVLVNSGIIVTSNSTGLFTNLSEGTYLVYAVNVKNSDYATLLASMSQGTPIVGFSGGLNPCYAILASPAYVVDCHPNISYSAVQPVCKRDAVTLSTSATGGKPSYSYLWNANLSGTINGTPAVTAPTFTFPALGNHPSYGPYFVTITDANGCITTGDALYVPIKPSLSKPVISPMITGCDGYMPAITSTCSNAVPDFSNAIFNFDKEDLLPIYIGTGAESVVRVSNDVGGPTFLSGNPSSGSSLNTSSWRTPTLDPNKFIEVCIRPESECYTLNITGFSFDYRRSGTGPQNLEIRYSTDGWQTFTILGSFSGFEDSQFLNSGILNLNQCSNAVCFRIYGYNASSSVGTLRLDNIKISGNSSVVRYNFYKNNINGTLLAAAVASYTPTTKAASGPEIICIQAVNTVPCNPLCASDLSCTTVISNNNTPSLSCKNHINISVDKNCEGGSLAELFTSTAKVLPEFYTVIVKTNKGKIVSPVSYKEFLGQTLTVSVVDRCNNNSCWGTMKIEDKMPPIIVCNSSITVQCDSAALFLRNNISGIDPNRVLFRPAKFDNCGFSSDSLLTLHDFRKDCGGMIVRNWSYTDCGGMTAKCKDTVFIVPINMDRIMCPNKEVVVDCGVDISPDGIYDFFGSNSTSRRNAYPYVNRTGTTPVRLDNVCSFITFYNDVTLEACSVGCKGNNKVIRRWTTLDWCTGNLYECTQVIKSIDTEGPTFLVNDETVSTNPWGCTADFWMPEVWELHDNCDHHPTITVKAADIVHGLTVTWVAGKGWRAAGVPCGVTTFKYIGTDCCGNETIHLMDITVADRTAPVPVTKQNIVVGLTPGYDAHGTADASAKLFAPSVDNGSNDNCSDVRIEIRRALNSPLCSNIGYYGHNNNRTYSSMPGINFSTSSSPTANITWTWTSSSGSRTRDAGVSPTNMNWKVVLIDEAQGQWTWRDMSVVNGATVVRPEFWDYTGSVGAGSTWRTSRANITRADATKLHNFLDTDGGKFVKFCCEDIPAGQAFGSHDVQMRVWDDGNKDGCIGCWVLATDANPNPQQDNFNETWSTVRVENNNPPILVCPKDATIFCDWPIETSVGVWKSVAGVNFDKTGVAEANGACGNPAVEFSDAEELDKCDLGWIRRTFRVPFTPKGSTTVQYITCRQNIRVLQSNSTQVWNFAADSRYSHTAPAVNTNQTVFCNAPTGAPAPVACTGPTAADIAAWEPRYVQAPCDVIGLNVSQPEQFDFEDGVCRKWVVKYKFVNWCDHKEVCYYKTFVFEDVIAPVVACKDTCIAAGANCKTTVTLTKSANDDGGCIPNDPNRWLKWYVVIDEWADGTVDYAYSSFVPTNWNFGGGQTLQVSPGVWVPAKYVAPSKPKDNITITFPNIIEGKHSYHKVTWKVTDGCHNFGACTETIEVKDKKAPTPYCVHLSTALMATPAGSTAKPMVELWARDFDKGSFDGDLAWPCTAQKDLLFTFNGEHPILTSLNTEHLFKGKGLSATPAEYAAGTAQKWLPATKTSGKIWTSDALQGKSSNEVQVNVSVWDWNLNTDFCMVNLKLVCNGNGCPTGGAGSRIAGTVATESNQTVSNVTVTIDANITEYPVSVTTPSNGTFEKSVPNGIDYEVTASKGGDYINGVSTLDLVMIQRHILGIETLSSPYKMIAADVNNDGKVTAQDLTELRKLILGIYNELPNNASWRFPISSQTMNASTPFPYLEKIAISSLDKDMMNQNFVAVKVGDVNGNVTTNVASPAVESRSANTVAMTVAEQTIAAGDVVDIAVTAANFNDVAGFQYTMNLKGASFVGIDGGAIGINDNNIGVIANDVVTMSYASDKGVTVANDEVLFTITVKADRAVKVSEMLSIGSAVTSAEAYTSDLKVGKVSLEVRTAPVTAIELMQNEPNPFKGQTTVSFNMPEPAAASLSVYDVTGKVVTVRNINANKGLNSETFTREQLGASGVMYYTLKSGDFTATKKMIIIE